MPTAKAEGLDRDRRMASERVSAIRVFGYLSDRHRSSALAVGMLRDMKKKTANDVCACGCAAGRAERNFACVIPGPSASAPVRARRAVSGAGGLRPGARFDRGEQTNVRDDFRRSVEGDDAHDRVDAARADVGRTTAVASSDGAGFAAGSRHERTAGALGVEVWRAWGD